MSMRQRLALTFALGIILAHVASVIAHEAGPRRPLAAQEQGDGGRFFVLGSESCRTCHRDIHEAWSERSHARAGESLGSEQMPDPRCQPCHMPVMEVETGVGCEACHGPGSAYSRLAVMIDPLKRTSAGLVDAGAGCPACHNPGHSFHVERDFRLEARRIHPVAVPLDSVH